MRPHDFVLAIDAGGSKTAVAVAQPQALDSPETVAGGPANPQVLGFEASASRMAAVIDQLRERLSIGEGPFAAAALAIAGAGRAEDREWFRDWATRTMVAERVAIVHDAEPLLAAVNPERQGVALVAGTGSFAFARGTGGRIARSGGWGYLLGDEGSGYDLVVQSLKAVARAHDGRGPATDLSPRLLQPFGISDPSELIATIYGGSIDRRRIASYAPVVFEASAAGDVVAAGILAQGADQLAAFAASAGGRACLPARLYTLALGGGVLVRQPMYVDLVNRSLAVREFEPERVVAVTDPIHGVLSIARELLET